MSSPLVRLVVMVTTSTSSLPSSPDVVPDGFQHYVSERGKLTLHAWLSPSSAVGPVLTVIGTFQEDLRFLGVLHTEVLQKQISPILVVSQSSLLDEATLQPLPTMGSTYDGTFQGKDRGTTTVPDDYQVCWWSTLRDEQADLLAHIGELWYAAVTQLVEDNLGAPIPAKQARVQDWQRHLINAAKALGREELPVPWVKVTENPQGSVPAH